MRAKHWFLLTLFAVAVIVGVLVFEEYDDVYFNADIL